SPTTQVLGEALVCDGEEYVSTWTPTINRCHHPVGSSTPNTWRP
ncbi:unnamed protein product, partial [Ectocarpus sp. 8 AP-2014]